MQLSLNAEWLGLYQLGREEVEKKRLLHVRDRVNRPLVTVEHHTLPVARSLAHLDWHLRHLWEGGWTTIVELPLDEHLAHHIEHGRGNIDESCPF